MFSWKTSNQNTGSNISDKFRLSRGTDPLSLSLLSLLRENCTLTGFFVCFRRLLKECKPNVVKLSIIQISRDFHVSHSLSRRSDKTKLFYTKQVLKKKNSTLARGRTLKFIALYSWLLFLKMRPKESLFSKLRLRWKNFQRKPIKNQVEQMYCTTFKTLPFSPAQPKTSTKWWKAQVYQVL